MLQGAVGDWVLDIFSHWEKNGMPDKIIRPFIKKSHMTRMSILLERWNL